MGKAGLGDAGGKTRLLFGEGNLHELECYHSNKGSIVEGFVASVNITSILQNNYFFFFRKKIEWKSEQTCNATKV